MRITLPLLALPLLLACADGVGRDRGFAVRDSAGVRIAESRSPAWGEGEAWRLEAEPGLTIGAVDGAPEQQLFRVRSAFRRADGGVVVANAGTHQVRAYDGEGDLLWATGREGDGPGEFRSISLVARFRGDSVAVYDSPSMRLSLFDRDGALGRTVTLPPLPQSAGSYAPIGLTSDGALVVSATLSAAGDPADREMGRRRVQEAVLRYDLDSATLDTLAVLPGVERVYVATERADFNGPAPFEWDRVDAVRGTELVSALTERFEVLVRDGAGGLRARVRAPIEPQPVTQAEMDEYLARAREELRESTVPAEIFEVFELRVEHATFPPTHPVLDRLLADADGHLWVRHARGAEAEGPREWSVLTADGRWLGTLGMPGAFEPRDIGSDYVLGVTTDELGVEYLHLYGLFRP